MPPEELHDSDLLSVASSTTPSTVQQSLENENIPVQLDELKIVGDNTENYIVNAYFPEGDGRNLAYTIVKEEPEIKPSLWNKFVDFVWPDYILKHLDYPSFKITFRSWCQLWVCTVLTIIPATSHWMGGAAYLIIVLGFITVSGGLYRHEYTFQYCGVYWCYYCIPSSCDYNKNYKPHPSWYHT